MIIGIDMGASAVKLAALEGDEVVLTHYEHGRRADVPALCEKLGLDLAAAEAVVLTGLSARKIRARAAGIKTLTVPEAEAIGRGGTWLSGRDNIVVASMGTGTAFVHAKGGVFTHLCGTGVGAGTLTGLSEKILGVRRVREIRRARHGRGHEQGRPHDRRLCRAARRPHRRPHSQQPRAPAIPTPARTTGRRA